MDNKLALYATGSRLLLIANFKFSWHKNYDKNKKSGPDKLYVLPPNLRICGHLPAPLYMGEEIAFENGQISDIQGLVTLTLMLDRSNMAYRHA